MSEEITNNVEAAPVEAAPAETPAPPVQGSPEYNQEMAAIGRINPSILVFYWTSKSRCPKQ